MAFDELKNMALGWIKDWNKGKLQKKLKETAQLAMNLTIENADLELKYRQLLDENRRLKKEKAKPKIKPVDTQDLEPRSKKPHEKKTKLDVLEADEEVVLDVEEDLPSDAKFVGYRDVLIQDLKIERKNIKFRLRRYYSEIERKTIEAKLPEDFKGHEFGPQLRSFIIYQYYKCRVPHKKIQEMLEDFGIIISAGTINKILNEPDEEFNQDMDSAREAATKKCNFVHLDETGAKYRGFNFFTYVVSNSHYTEFTTLERKKRESAREALKLDGRKYKIRFIITDDAPNFTELIKNHQLCWVHEIRKYKLCEVFKKIESATLEKLLKEWRRFYRLMKWFRRHPKDELKSRIQAEFERITSIKTMVKPLDEQLARTKKNKEKLLLFLKYPRIPIQNNLAEQDLRERVIKRKISMQNRSRAGIKAWDLMLSLVSTCRKNHLSFWRYLTDRICKREEIYSLGRFIAYQA